MSSAPVLRRLILSRYLFELALQNARTDREVGQAACVNLLQDSIELFMLAALDHLDAKVGVRTEFPQYLDKINEALSEELPFRRRLIEINKVRVQSKHEGIPPNPKEVEGYISDARKFLEQACEKILGVDYWSVSLIQFLEDNETKAFLKEAESRFEAREYADCLIECRKAFFNEFEADYDTQKDLNEKGLLFGSRAPYYARQKKHIEQHVRTPFDYIQFDHGQVDADLTKEGIDHTSFWNVWRLTPQVYRHDSKDPWLVKRELHKLEEDGLRDRAAYVLETIVGIVLARQSNRRLMKSTRGTTRYVAKLRKPKTTVYAKADRSSPVVGDTADLTEIMVDYATPGLNGDGTYWNVGHLFKGGPFLIGYIPEEDLLFE